jgi:hypothetical protein
VRGLIVYQAKIIAQVYVFLLFSQTTIWHYERRTKRIKQKNPAVNCGIFLFNVIVLIIELPHA